MTINYEFVSNLLTITLCIYLLPYFQFSRPSCNKVEVNKPNSIHPDRRI